MMDLRIILICIRRSYCHGNGHLNTTPKSNRHTASISHGQLNCIDSLAGTLEGNLNPLDSLAGT